MRHECPTYLSSIVRSLRPGHNYGTRGQDEYYINLPRMRKEIYKKSFVPSSISLWNGLDFSLKLCASCDVFKKKILKNSSLKPSHLPLGLPRKAEVILAQLRLGFSDLNAHLFAKGCTDSPHCNCSATDETVHHFLFDCDNYSNNRQTFFTNIRDITSLPLNTNLLLFGDESLSSDANSNIINQLIIFILSSNRF